MMFKGRLHTLCQQRGWGKPKYTEDREGPQHAPTYSATVAVNGAEFRSPGTGYRTVKQALDLAAKVAFERLSAPPPTPPPGPETQLPYKSQLQDYTLKIHKCLPSYRNNLSGPPHAPLFKSTVTIDGRTFESPEEHGRKKEAESAVARVAFLSLTQEAKPSEQMLLPNEGRPSKKQKQMHVADLDFQHSKNNSHSGGSGIQLPIADETEPRDEATKSGEVENDKPAAPEQSMMAEIKDFVELFLLVQALPTNTCNLVATSTGPSTEAATAAAATPVARAGCGNLVATSTGPSTEAATAAAVTPVAHAGCGCSKPAVQIQVYRRHPKLALPEGATVLPCSNNEWVAVSLPSPRP